jgi:hypothetical protein
VKVQANRPNPRRMAIPGLARMWSLLLSLSFVLRS